MNESLCFKLKVGSKTHLEQIQKEGLLYCNTLKYFTGIEDNGVRGDSHESALDYKFQKDVIVQLWPAHSPEKVAKLKCAWLQSVVRNSEPFGNLFCLYNIDMINKEDSGRISIDIKNREFGSHVLVFLNTLLFDELLVKKLREENRKFSCGKVKYVNLKTYHGRKTLFQKDIRYAYQNEWRLFIENDRQEPLIIKLGNLSAISKIYKFDEFCELQYSRSLPKTPNIKG